MKASCSMFSQILTLVTRIEFERMVRETGAEYAAKGFSSWSQFVAVSERGGAGIAPGLPGCGSV